MVFSALIFSILAFPNGPAAVLCKTEYQSIYNDTQARVERAKLINEWIERVKFVVPLNNPKRQKILARAEKLAHIAYFKDRVDREGRSYPKFVVAQYVERFFFELPRSMTCSQDLPKLYRFDAEHFKRLAKRDCFNDAYYALRRVDGNSYGPLKACESANEVCNTDYRCGGCGPAADPSLRFQCPNTPQEIQRTVNRFANRGLHLNSCGGTPEGADKLAHCWALCAATRCSMRAGAVGGGAAAMMTPFPLKVLGTQLGENLARSLAEKKLELINKQEIDPDDGKANTIGYDIGAHSEKTCYESCAERTRDMIFE